MGSLDRPWHTLLGRGFHSGQRYSSFRFDSRHLIGTFRYVVHIWYGQCAVDLLELGQPVRQLEEGVVGVLQLVYDPR